MENKFKCAYPGCKKEGDHTQSFGIINEKGANVELLFCQYHSFVVMGGHFQAWKRENVYDTVKKVWKKERGFELKGPFKEIEVIEQVMGARELMGKLKNDNKNLKEKKP